MALAGHLTLLLDGLPRDWSTARVDVTVEEPAEAERAALILASAAPGRAGSTFRLHVSARDTRAGVTADQARRSLARLDEAGIRARLKVGSVAVAGPEPPLGREERAERRTLAAAWDELLAKLPADWSDLLAEVELDSTDFVEVGALALGPVNPYLVDGERTLRFRAAHRFGYGAAPQMARRCLERLDDGRITGELRILRVLSDTKPVATQGPVWRVGGRAV